MSDFVLCEECSKKLSGNDVVYLVDAVYAVECEYYCSKHCLMLGIGAKKATAQNVIDNPSYGYGEIY